MHVISASRNDVEGKGNEAEATFELEVIPQLCNPMNNMHGGAMALLVDMTTTMAGAPISRQGWWEFGGVSRTLSVTYVRPALLGTTVAVTCVLRSVSSRLCKFVSFLDHSIRFTELTFDERSLNS
ncbi:HotDog domain-containing protein [Bipolaris maydis]|nr:HotDog domain-containing protein [Bipolaris maydis]